MGGRGSGRKPYRHLTRVGVNPQQQVPLSEAVSDPDGVFGEFEALASQARATSTLDAYRHVHEAALVCRENGYAVRFHALPYIVALSGAMIDAKSAAERKKLKAEITAVYADVREWRDRDG